MLNNRRPGARNSVRVANQQAASAQVQSASSAAVVVPKVANALQAGSNMEITYDPVLAQILFDAEFLP